MISKVRPLDTAACAGFHKLLHRFFYFSCFIPTDHCDKLRRVGGGYRRSAWKVFVLVLPSSASHSSRIGCRQPLSLLARKEPHLLIGAFVYPFVGDSRWVRSFMSGT